MTQRNTPGSRMESGDATNVPRGLPQYDGVLTRLLDDDERPYPTYERQTPLLIQAQRSSAVGALIEFVATHSDSIRRNVYEHGAVLFRGFAIESSRQIEDVLLAFKGFRPMGGYFMGGDERGDAVKGTKYIFETNRLFKTGGDFRFGGIHSENYYSPDVPSLQCFCCLKRPWFGGETALIHMAHAYAEVRQRLAAKLESEAFLASVFPLSTVAVRYRLTEEAVERFLNENNVSIARCGEEVFMMNYKPSVLRHPHTKECSLQVHLSNEVHGLGKRVVSQWHPRYGGLKWALHRAAWKRPKVLALLTNLTSVPKLLMHPRAAVKTFVAPRVRRLLKPSAIEAQQRNRPVARTIGQVLDHEDVRLLADAISKHSAVFTWKTGDLLIVDNLQMLHAGMPGFGPRDIKVALGAPVPMSDATGSGLHQVSTDEDYESLHLRIVKCVEGSRASYGSG